MKLIIPALLAATAVSAIVAAFDGTLTTQAQTPSIAIRPVWKSPELPPLELVVSERDRALGTAKLKEAFRINGEQMCCGYIDTSQVPCYEIKGVTGQSFFECGQPTMPDANKIKTETIIPIPLGNAELKNELDWQADQEAKRRFMNRTFKATREQLGKTKKHTEK